MASRSTHSLGYTPRVTAADSPALDRARDALRRSFGHADFRGLQAQVVAEVLAGRNALAVLPTGGGKSICYQVPAMVMDGLGVVVSPLIALMSDQVAGLQQSGVAAARLDSTTDPAERADTWRRIAAGTLDLLYVSPEGLMQGWMLERLSQAKLALIAIDEAHCVSQWGHDFRPEYRTLGRLAELFPETPRLAVTATADARTRADIKNQLRIDDAREFVDSFARPELQLSAERKQGQATRRVLQLVSERPNRSGVIYAGSRDGVERLAQALTDQGQPALAYHAGLDKAVRERRLHQFLDDDAQVIVATIAFGMGVDKPDVRYVIHADPPASIEAYWQEVGRAGRDGAPAEGITLYGASDLAWALRRIASRDLGAETAQIQTRKARQLYAMLDGMGCRAAAVRRYFGEDATGNCGQCDLCLNPPESIDVTEAAQKALSAVHRLGGRFGRGRIVDHLLGKTKAPSPGEAALSTFGVGQELAMAGWRELLDQLAFEGLLLEDPNDGRPLVTLGDTDGVRAVYRGERRIRMRKAEVQKSARRAAAKQARAGLGAEVGAADRPLFEALKAWRKREASLQGLPPYVIFHDRTLAEIARERPGTLARLAECGGVGQGKLERYGRAVLEILVEATQSP